MIKQTGNARV